MITKEQARTIAEHYLTERKRKYLSICSTEKITVGVNKKALYGKHKGKLMDMLSVEYGQIFGVEERSIYVKIDADTGEVLYSVSPHGFIEEWEDRSEISLIPGSSLLPGITFAAAIFFLHI